MNYSIVKKIPTLEELTQAFPLSLEAESRVLADREEIKNILAGDDSRLLMVVGPCSAWPANAVLDYAEKLVKLGEQLKSVMKLVMRVYIQKPRTTRGWTGPVNQPDPFAYPDIEKGLKYVREMMIKVIEMGLPIADEASFTHNAKGFLELLSWVAIGARSSEDQEHRIFASALECAVGMKNPTHGSLLIGVNSVMVAQYPHVTIFDGYEVQTQGNPYAHLVLRGGDNAPNYSIAHLEAVKQVMEIRHIKNPSVVIDTSHDNCLVNGKKDYLLQPKVAFEVLESLKNRPDLKKLVKGFMVESFIKENCQKIDPQNSSHIDLDGLSITDPCLSWEQTQDFLLELADRLQE